MFVISDYKMRVSSDCAISKFIIINVGGYKPHLKMNIYFFYNRKK